MKEKISSFEIYFLKAIGKIPFKILYIISDILYFIVFHVIRYRKKIVFSNLRNSFPEKSEKEIKLIAKKYYHHLTDLFFESVKLYRMTDKEMDKHLTTTGVEKLTQYFEQGKSVILLGMHYNNWEWCSSLQRKVKHQIYVVYNPIKNKKLGRFLLDAREKFGSKTVDMAHTARMALSAHKNEHPIALVLTADQSAPANSHFWTTFLHQETGFFAGPEHIAVKTNQPVFLFHCKKIKRGKYEVNLSEIVMEPAKVNNPEDILLIYAEKLEKIIQENPEYWLWSHRRWKHKRPEGTKLVPRKLPTD
ncbi:MAG: lysophospholipid acyltransferase family protein [Prolixibacteraceae bacterium]|nr:lysophospholipid acyltransferase family protein [Prolixibacteraceae bacterium]